MHPQLERKPRLRPSTSRPLSEFQHALAASCSNTRGIPWRCTFRNELADGIQIGRGVADCACRAHEIDQQMAGVAPFVSRLRTRQASWAVFPSSMGTELSKIKDIAPHGPGLSLLLFLFVSQHSIASIRSLTSPKGAQYFKHRGIPEDPD